MRVSRTIVHQVGASGQVVVLCELYAPHGSLQWYKHGQP